MTTSSGRKGVRLDEQERRVAESVSEVADSESLRNWRAWVVRDPLTQRLLHARPYSRSAQVARRAFIDAWRDQLTAAINRVLDSSPIERGALNPPIEPDQTAVAIIAALHGGTVLSRLARDPLAVEIALDVALAPLTALVEQRRLDGESPSPRPSMGR